MKNELIKILVNYAKGISCTNEDYDHPSCKKPCALKGIPYLFNSNGTSYSRNLCFLITHSRDVKQFKESLQDLTIKLSIKGK